MKASALTEAHKTLISKKIAAARECNAGGHDGILTIS
jgi:hypothetical protein